MKKRVARVKPAKRRQKSVGVSSKLCVNGRQELIHRRYPIAADQPIHLHPERHECDQINQAKRAQKPAPRPKVSWRPRVFSPEQPSYRRSEAAMTGDEFVSGFGNRRESRNVIVTPRQPFSRRSISQRAIDGFRGKKYFAIRLNQNHRALEVIDWNFGKAPGTILIRSIIDLADGEF